MEEYKRSDFIDDSIVIDFPLRKDLIGNIEQYEKLINDKKWIMAEDYNDNLWVTLKNSAIKYSKEQIKIIRHKYKIDPIYFWEEDKWY